MSPRPVHHIACDHEGLVRRSPAAIRSAHAEEVARIHVRRVAPWSARALRTIWRAAHVPTGQFAGQLLTAASPAPDRLSVTIRFLEIPSWYRHCLLKGGAHMKPQNWVRW